MKPRLAGKARAEIGDQQSPAALAKQYRGAIETIMQGASTRLQEAQELQAADTIRTPKKKRESDGPWEPAGGQKTEGSSGVMQQSQIKYR